MWSFDYEQYQQGVKCGDSVGENESVVKFISRLYDIVGNNWFYDVGDVVDKMDKVVGVVDVGFMYYVLDNCLVDCFGYIEEKDGD